MNNAFIVAHTAPRPWLVRLDPRLKLAWLVAISLVAVAVDSFAELSALCLFAALPLLGLRLSARAAWVLVGLIALSLWSTMLSQGIFYKPEERTLLVDLPWLQISLEGMLYGAQQGLRFVAGVIAGAVTVITTSPERLLAALVWLRIPSAIGFVVVSALRWFPTLIDEWAAVRRARQLRDGGVRSGTLATWIGEFALFMPLVASSLRRAATLATSVTARGFDPGRERTFYPALHMPLGELLACALLGLATAAICAAKLIALRGGSVS